MANHFEEAKMLGVAHQYQRVTDWHERIPPGY
jgi:aspartyl-tRNA(Asn)/glutamyl-tRNA(Gln) amidotransferase subunit A